MTAEAKPAKRNLKIILDSNALFVPFQFKIDIFEELEKTLKAHYEPIILTPVLQELEKLTRGNSPKMRKDATYALKLAEKCKVSRLAGDVATTTDDAIVKAAAEWNCPVFTNDRTLRNRLRDINVPVVYVRQKSRLEIEGRL
jgi:hypothetical protein